MSGRRIAFGAVGSLLVLAAVAQTREGPAAESRTAVMSLPKPSTSGAVSLEAALAARRSVRAFAPASLSPDQLGQLCWAGQGISDPRSGRRTAPSAGALYPMELYAVTADGVWHYRPAEHVLEAHLAGDLRAPLRAASLGQEAVGEAPLCLVVAAVVGRSEVKYGRRAERYCWMEAGHIAQNVLLQATALGLGGVPVGAFEDRRVAEVLRLPRDCRPMYLLPLGVPAE